MHVVRIDDVPKIPRKSALFTSEEVTAQSLIPEGGDFTMNVVNFGMGVRNKFHVHESDQILIVTAGKVRPRIRSSPTSTLPGRAPKPRKWRSKDWRGHPTVPPQIRLI